MDWQIRVVERSPANPGPKLDLPSDGTMFHGCILLGLFVEIPSDPNRSADGHFDASTSVLPQLWFQYSLAFRIKKTPPSW